MARNNAPKIELTAYDDLFETDESRAEAALSKIREIPISEIDEFPANSHFLRTAGPYFPDSPGHIKRTAWDISRAEGTPPY